MSTQLLVSAVGAAVGFVASGFNPAGAQYGWMIGAAIGAVAFQPTQKYQGPRLDDLKVTGLAYGAPIPFIQGTARPGGFLAWSSDRREIVTVTREDGKGGPKQQNTTYTYEQDCLYKLSSNELSGMLRVWDNGKLIYSADASASNSSLIASSETEAWRRITFYSGAPGQLPDPTYEAAVGADYALAYEGEGTVFIEGLQLGQSGQMRQLTFEVGTNLTPGVMQDYQDHSPNGVVVSQVTSNPVTNRWGGTVDRSGGFGASGHFLGGNVLSPGEALSFYSAALGSRNLPVEFHFRGWLEDNGAGLVSNFVLSCGNSDGNLSGLWIRRTPDTEGGVMRVTYRGPQSFTLNSTVPAPRNSRYFLEVSKFGNTVMMFFDGIPVGTYTNNNLDGVELFCQPSDWELGANYGLNPCWHGYMDDVMLGRSRGNVEAYIPPTGPQIPNQFTDLYIPFYRVETAARGNETLRTVVERLCARAGMPAGTYDASALDAITRPVRSLSVSQIGGTRATLDILAQTYFFQQYCTDKIYFVPRAQSPVATIQYGELGAAPQMEDTPEPLALRLASDIEVPAQEALTYANVSDDYQTDTQYSDRINTTQTSTSAVTVPLGFTPSEAKAIADARVTDAGIAVIGTQLSLPRSRSALTPGDSVVVLDKDGSVYRMVLGRCTAKNGILGFDARMEDPTVFDQAGITGEDYQPQTVVVAIPGTYLLMLDIPLLRDADDGVGLYAVARGLSPHWPGANVLESADDLTYQQKAAITEAGVIGMTTTALTTWGGANTVDESSSVTVNVGPGVLNSITYDQLIGSTTLNAALVGQEIVQFRTATQLSPGVYLLTGFLRGRRGTERVMSGHVTNERFVLLQPVGMRRVEQSVSDLGATRYFRGVSIGRLLSSAATQPVVNTGASVKPFSVVDVRANRNTADTVISWNRRTRRQTRFLGPLSSSVPLGEALELYEVDIYSNNTFTTVVRRLASDPLAPASNVTYTSAQQTADFGAPQSALYVRVYQISELAGRGYPSQAVI